MRLSRVLLVVLSASSCVGLVSEEPDSGPDSGEIVDARDAGRDDAGAVDGGAETDAGELDAGELDAGELDAGELDAGELDAGELDAGPRDAGDVDAGQPDAGSPDAGRVDAGLPDAGTDGGLGYDPATCTCTREILPTESNVSLSALAPGSVVCLRASTAATRGALTLSGLNGTPANPVLIRNCDGAVRIESTTGAFPLTLVGTGFRVSGGGALNVPYGLRITGSAADFLVYVGRSSEFELDHLELFSSNFAGISAKVDPSGATCSVADRRYDSFAMEGIDIHHNWIHHMNGGEGVYLGNSFYNGAGARYCYATANTTCNRGPCGTATEQFPHELRRVRVHHNLVQHTAWDGIQVGAAVDDCVISDNRIENYGEAENGSQNHGIQVGLGSSCLVERNLVKTGPKAMTLQGIGDVVVRNNVFDDFHAIGIEVNPRPTPLTTDIVPSDYRGGFIITQNTFIASLDAGATVIGDVNAAAVGDLTPFENIVSNNLLVSPSSSWFRRTDSRYGWSASGNLQFSSLAGAGLDQVSSGDYCPSALSPAVDAADAGPGVSDDLLGRLRPLGARADVGALECH